MYWKGAGYKNWCKIEKLSAQKVQRGEQTKGTEFVFPGEQRDVKASMMVFRYAEDTRGRAAWWPLCSQTPGRVRKPRGCGREEVTAGCKWSGQSDRKDVRAGLGCVPGSVGLAAS